MIRKNILFSNRDLSLASHTRSFAEIARSMHPSDIADNLASLSREKTLTLLAGLDAETAADVFSYFSEDKQKELFLAMNADRAARMFEHLPADERADFYVLLDTDTQQRLLPLLSPEIRENLLQLSAFPEESTGSATTSEYLSVLPEVRVSAALKTVRAAARKSETVYIVYVLDRDRHLLGTVSLRELLLADDDTAVESIMRRHPVCVRASWPRERSTEMIRRYDLLALPVMDDDNKMMGIITVDDAMDMEKEQDASQLARFGGTATADDSDLDILTSPMSVMFRVRVFWLIFLTVFGVITSTFVAAQEEILSHVIVLAAFIAPIVDMGGNTGSQAATLVIRAMAVGDVTLSTRHMSFRHRVTSPTAMARMTSVAAWLPVLPPMSTMGAIKAASTMTWERISSCAATKVLVITPNTVRKISQNTRTRNMTDMGDVNMSRSESSAVAVPPKRASWEASCSFSISMASSTVIMPIILLSSSMTGSASRS